MRVKLLLCVLLMALSGLVIVSSRGEDQHGQVFDFLAYNDLGLIAHAGGGLEAGMYSNSLEALNRSARSGHSLIEVDFSATKSGELVLIHDWGRTYKQYFEPSSVAQMMALPGAAKVKRRGRRIA